MDTISTKALGELNLNFSSTLRKQKRILRIKSLEGKDKLPLDSFFQKLLAKIHRDNQEPNNHSTRRHKYSLQDVQDGIQKNKQNVEQETHNSNKLIQLPKPRKLFGRVNEINLSNFVLGSMIGSGTFGDVFVCKEKTTGACYALKKILKSTIESYRLESQLINELKIHGSLKHPNIIQFYGCFHDQYHIFLLTQYANQGILLKQTKKGEKFTSRILASVIDAVAHLQSNDIIHRDIKPQNIVMVNGVPKLCDFGWATVCKTTRKTFCGTLDYVSPEILENRDYNDSVDLWSLGVLCYQLITGQPPFKGTDKNQKMNMIKNVKLSVPAWVSHQATDFIKRSLCKQPSERMKIHEASQHPLILKYQSRKPRVQ